VEDGSEEKCVIGCRVDFLDGAGLIAEILGGVGRAQARRSAEPDFEVEARLPCLAINRREDERIDAVVLMLKVL